MKPKDYFFPITIPKCLEEDAERILSYSPSNLDNIFPTRFKQQRDDDKLLKLLNILSVIIFTIVIAGFFAWSIPWTHSYYAPVEPITPVTAVLGEVTAYSASVEQTDDRPREMANGEEVFEGAIANNCLPFGAEVDMGGNTYTVTDRMHMRYGCYNFDIFMESEKKALKWGVQTKTIQISQPLDEELLIERRKRNT